MRSSKIVGKVYKVKGKVKTSDIVRGFFYVYTNTIQKNGRTKFFPCVDESLTAVGDKNVTTSQLDLFSGRTSSGSKKHLTFVKKKNIPKY